MKVPISWLKDFVDITVPVAQLAEMLTLSGAEVKHINKIVDLENVVVGEIVAIEPHPMADRLQLVTVNTGSGLNKVVCGAPNVRIKQKIAYAFEGAVLFDSKTGNFGTILKRSKIRGIESSGMVCSKRELGLDDEHESILELDAQLPVGVTLHDAIGEDILEFSITPNRVDHLSILGIAREVAAITGQSVKYPNLADPLVLSENGELILDVKDYKQCDRYFAIGISNIKIKPSPTLIKHRLELIGEKSINNIVDLSNYIMFEIGQPTHTFDYQKILGKSIIIRDSYEEEEFVALNGYKYKLKKSQLVVANAKNCIALAGVLGGMSSAITPETSDIVLESANFKPERVRFTSQTNQLLTESARRFQRHLPVNLTEIACRRFLYLLRKYDPCIEIFTCLDSRKGSPFPTKYINYEPQKARKILGSNISDNTQRKLLISLGFEVKASPNSTQLIITKPNWRSDVNIVEDIVEEIARIDGYDKIRPHGLSPAVVSNVKTSNKYFLQEKIVDLALSAGLDSVITYITSRNSDFDLLDDSKSRAIELLNPISEERAYLRTSLIGNLLEVTARNLSSRRPSVAIFELGEIFSKNILGTVDEKLNLSIMIAGNSSNSTLWDKGRMVDFYDAKGYLEEIMEGLGLEFYLSKTLKSYLTKGISAEIKTADGTSLGIIGLVRREIAANFGIKYAPVFVVELDFDKINKKYSKLGIIKYVEKSKYPPAFRVLSLVIGSDIEAQELVFEMSKNKLVHKVEIVDWYTDDNLLQGKKSLAFRLTMLSKSKTLTKQAIDATEKAILNQLKRKFEFEIR